MRIQHNIMAMNAYRNYNTNTSALSKNLERLSSGYKINRAGDDAAGLAISEKMRAQITGLEAAQKNVKDGVSLVKTAEGAMQEIQDMLNRMEYLATQSANGTYDNEVDRANLQKEVDALRTEIDRIADSANFNGIKLLDGSLEKIDATGAYTETISIEESTVTGRERILKSVIGDDEIAYKVAGQKTILDTPTAQATTGKFEIDFKDLRFTNFASGSGTIESISITINGKAIKTTLGTKISSAKGDISASSATKIASKVAQQIISKLKTNTAGAAASVVSLNGVDWRVSASGGKISFEQVKVPKTFEEAQMNFDIKVTNVKIKTEATTSLEVTGALKAGTYVVRQAQPIDGSRKANTVFQVTADDLRDGTKITIGTRTVTLQVGADSDYKTLSGSDVVNLMDMEEGNIDTAKLFVALGRISKAFGSQVTGNVDAEGNQLKSIKGSAANASIAFQVGVTSGKTNGVEWAGLAVSRTDNGTQCVFNTLDKLSSIFKIEVEAGEKEIQHEAVDAQDGLTLQIGDTADKFNQMSVAVGDMHVKAMSYEDDEGNKSSIATIDISKQDSAAKAIDVIKNAINYVSSVRGDLGAVQNRLEHTANNLSVMAENIQDAESTIRDTDIAEEMMAYTKNNILIQSAQAMLAQANAVPQGVLQLLG